MGVTDVVESDGWDIGVAAHPRELVADPVRVEVAAVRPAEEEMAVPCVAVPTAAGFDVVSGR